jgi:thioredoxin reductase
METSMPGIFAVGDICSKEMRQIDVACAEDTVAAIVALHYLEKRSL